MARGYWGMKSQTRAMAVVLCQNIVGRKRPRRGRLTEVLDVLVSEITESTAGLLCAGLLASAPCLVNHDAVCDSGSDEGNSV